MQGIHHLALRVSDCERSARFYEQAMGLSRMRCVESEGHVNAVWLRAGDAVLMLERALRGEGAENGSGHVLVFPASSLTSAESRLNDLKIRIVDRTSSTLYVQDPDGHRVGLSEYRFDPLAS